MKAKMGYEGQVAEVSFNGFTIYLMSDGSLVVTCGIAYSMKAKVNESGNHIVISKPVK